MSYSITDVLNLCENNYIKIDGMKITGYGSWRGSYDEPCIYVQEDVDECITSGDILTTINSLTNGDVFYGYKGGEYTYDVNNMLNFEPTYKAWTNGEYDKLLASKCPELNNILLPTWI